jgi:hypothetical protein
LVWQKRCYGRGAVGVKSAREVEFIRKSRSSIATSVNILRLPRVEIPRSADQARPTLLALVRRQHLPQRRAFAEAARQHRKEPARGTRRR